ncbi:DNA glycosylase [Pasteurellaceae bacterium LIM206]|nr:DNA glycosylase [Pasteurellaceae bacterium LIM206]
MSEPIIETYPFQPVLPPHAKVMMMGTFPPPREKRSMEFHYPNFQNDMWRVYGLVFFNDKEHFQVPGEKRFDPEKIKAFFYERGIASCPTAVRVIRGQGNASDKFLKVVEAVHLDEVLQKVPLVRWLFTTGGKATETLFSLVPELNLKEPKTNQFIEFPYHGHDLKLYRVPSTSRAYPLSLEKKAEAYANFFKLTGVL